MANYILEKAPIPRLAWQSKTGFNKERKKKKIKKVILFLSKCIWILFIYNKPHKVQAVMKQPGKLYVTLQMFSSSVFGNLEENTL